MADKSIQINQWNGTAYDRLFPYITALNIPAGTIAAGTNITVSRNASTGVITISAAASAVLEVVAFDANGWGTANNIRGYYSRTLALSGKRIVALLNASNEPAGHWVGSTIYANAAFSGVAVLG